MPYFYPIVHYPLEYVRIVQSKPEIPAAPKRPTEPVKPSVPSEEPFGWSEFIYLSAFIVGVILVNDKDSRGIGALLMLFSIAGPIMFLGRIFGNDRKKAKAYQKSYPELMAHYEAELNHYDRLFYDYFRLKLNLESQEAVFKFRTIQFHNNFKLNALPGNNVDKRITKGISEDLFHTYLVKFFGDKISTNQRVLYYYPDFIYYDPEARICIDIEIDEPYVGSSGEPIHFDYQDIRRDGLFTENGWMVVRFSEEQVIKHPGDCCRYISHLISLYQKLAVGDDSELIVERISTWSKDQAHKMAFQRYRNSYLPQSMRDKLKSETFENDPQEFYGDDLPF